MALDKLAAVEARIKGLVDAVQTLKRTNTALETELRLARRRLSAQEEANQRWERERADVRSRVQKVMDELDLLDGCDDEGRREK